MMKIHSIKSLDEILEQFYNPFEEIDYGPKIKIGPISDKGGVLNLRKEVFNINRVEYTKKENGRFTVLSKTQFARGEIVEISPVIFVDQTIKSVKVIKDYVFEIDKEKQIYGIVLGYGSLYNHSIDPNVEFAYNRSNKQLYFVAKRTIQAQEELTINFGTDYWKERVNFNTMGNSKQVEENEIDQNHTDLTGNYPSEEGGTVSQITANFNASPDNINQNMNPATSGIPISGGGQS